MNMSMHPNPAVITRGRKFDQVRDGAAAIFLRDGYAGASVDDIARAARVSKATLYSYFPEKSLMFREVLRATSDSAFRQAPFDTDRTGPVADALPAILTQLAQWALSAPRLELLRSVTAEATRFPQEAASFDAMMTDRVVAPLARVIAGWIETGQLAAHDHGQSARQLVTLVTTQVQQPALLTGKAPPADRIAAEAAQLFLSAHAAGHR